MVFIFPTFLEVGISLDYADAHLKRHSISLNLNLPYVPYIFFKYLLKLQS